MIAGLALTGTECILDLGCGDGVLTSLLAESVTNGQVVGIDASEGMLSAASRYKAENLSFIHIDMLEMDFRAQFDLALSNAALHWVHDHKTLLGRVYAALIPGGGVRFLFGGIGNYPCLNEGLAETIAMPRFNELFEGFTWPWYHPSAEEYENLLKGAGFRDASAHINAERRSYASAEAVKRWLEQPCLVPFWRT